MANSFFSFKQFTIHQDRCAMKVTTDACLFGAWAADELKKNSNIHKLVLDIGAGTGLLSLMLAQKLKNCAIKAIEIDKEAAMQAVENTRNSPLGKQIEIVHADVRENLLTEKADLIISNPPFYEEELKSSLFTKNQAHHDESLLLGELIPIIKQQLHPNGFFFILLPYKRKSEIEKLLWSEELHVEKEILVKPSPQKDYFRIMLKGIHKHPLVEKTFSQTMEITDTTGNYSRSFIALLKDYYLYLKPA